MLKWQTALLDDPCLWVVPGSHARYRTERERKVLLERKGDLPGQVQISLKRGQTVFWSHKLIHRGRMPESMDRRLSVAGCLKVYDPNAENDYASERWNWRTAENLRDYLPVKLQLFYDRWRSLRPPTPAT